MKAPAIQPSSLLPADDPQSGRYPGKGENRIYPYSELTDIDGKPKVVKAATLSGADNVLFRRNSVTGTVEAVPWKSEGVALNTDLHAN